MLDIPTSHFEIICIGLKSFVIIALKFGERIRTLIICLRMLILHYQVNLEEIGSSCKLTIIV